MRIVLLSPTLPLPFGRADARWLYVIASELSRRSMDIVCISCYDEPAERVDEANRLAGENGYELRTMPRLVTESRARKARDP